MMSQWSPPVDILEDEKEFLVKAELPDIKKEDVHVTVENGVLTISGERRKRRKSAGTTAWNGPTAASLGVSACLMGLSRAKCMPSSKTAC